MADDLAARPPGRVATVGGVVGPIVMIVVVWSVLRATSGPGAEMGPIVAGSVFFGLAAFDLLLAIRSALRRRRGETSDRYSSLFAMTIFLLAIWLMVAGSALNSHHGWMAKPLIVLIVGPVAIAVEVVGVNRLGRVDAVR